MVDVIDGSETVSTHGIINWILLLVIFSVITVVGNWIGYKHPIFDSLIGMLILSIITLAGLLLESYLHKSYWYCSFHTYGTDFSICS